MTIQLPTEPKVPNNSLYGRRWLVYGEAKTGKSTLASTFPKALFLDFESRLEGLPVYAIRMKRWTDAEEAVAQMMNPATRGGFETIVIDTIDAAFALCRDQVLREKGVPHESSNNFILPPMIRERFFTFVRAVASLGVGDKPMNVVSLSHCDRNIITDTNGTTTTEIRLALRDKHVVNLVKSLTDIIAYTDITERLDPKTRQSEVVYRLNTKKSALYTAAVSIGTSSLPEKCKPDFNWMVQHLIKEEKSEITKKEEVK